MSSRVESKRNNVSKPYCGTCHKAGKSLQEYTSHWTRASKAVDAVVTCPLVLATVCSYCRKTGHWKKFCPVLQSKSVAPAKATPATKGDVKKPTQKKVSNRFESLDEEEEEEKVEVVAPVVDPNSWASVLKREPIARPVVAKHLDTKPLVTKALVTKALVTKALVAKALEILPMALSDVVTPQSKDVVVDTFDLSKARKLDWASLMKQTISTNAAAPPIVVIAEKPFLKTPPVLPGIRHFRKKILNWADCESSDDEEEEEYEESEMCYE